MPAIDGFQLFETIGLEMDLPIIMMSMYNNQDYVEFCMGLLTTS
ncbi:unnamed protein product [Rhodiola kirilowii]